MANKPIILATRGSALALAQAHAVLRQCREAFPALAFEIRVYKTTGDKLQTAALAQSELPKGLFTKELEAALLNGEADIAVHSLKDLPTALPEGLALGAVGQREDARDILVTRVAGSGVGRGYGPGASLATLAPGCVVATSSTRRAAQVRELRPDVDVAPIRGNVGTRLRKLAENADIDATLLAAAGIRRLGFIVDTEGRLSGGPPDSEAAPPGLLRVAFLSPLQVIPCVGQAAVGIEIRADDNEVSGICAGLNHRETELCVRAERSFLSAMGGGCQAAVAAHGVIEGAVLRLRAVSYLGREARRASGEAPMDQAELLGADLAALLAGPSENA
ncbi:MAG: hydroxymethylbilane synthase [Verrucomicrobia bacterium]|nr:hydroxymethylbilane synthase [Verrucomicrobiota bacterium]MBI3870123.1 hydroxymethylbilane synthase [Verrucomicrobiota bacterium]